MCCFGFMSFKNKREDTAATDAASVNLQSRGSLFA